MAKQGNSVKVVYESPTQTHIANVSLRDPGMPLRQALAEAAPDLGIKNPEQYGVLVNGRGYGLDTTVSAGDVVRVVSPK